MTYNKVQRNSRYIWVYLFNNHIVIFGENKFKTMSTLRRKKITDKNR